MTLYCFPLSNISVPVQKPSSPWTLSLISWTQRDFVLADPTVRNNFPHSSLLVLVLFSLQPLSQVPPALQNLDDFPISIFALFQTSVELVIIHFLWHLTTWFMYCFSLFMHMSCVLNNYLFLERQDLSHFCIPESKAKENGHVMSCSDEVRQQRELVKNTDSAARVPEFEFLLSQLLVGDLGKVVLKKIFCALISSSL